jgi:hypothetical protein
LLNILTGAVVRRQHGDGPGRNASADDVVCRPEAVVLADEFLLVGEFEEFDLFRSGANEAKRPIGSM